MLLLLTSHTMPTLVWAALDEPVMPRHVAVVKFPSRMLTEPELNVICVSTYPLPSTGVKAAYAGAASAANSSSQQHVPPPRERNILAGNCGGRPAASAGCASKLWRFQVSAQDGETEPAAVQPRSGAGAAAEERPDDAARRCDAPGVPSEASREWDG